MTTETTTLVEPIRACLITSTGYGQMLVADIPAEKFAHQPHPQMNHPAFCMGHLAIYPDNALKLVGREDLARPEPIFDELFAAGVECVADPAGCPSKDVIVDRYVERHEALAAALEEVGDAVLLQENPAEGRFKAMCPTIGAALNFYANNHHMMHLGQVSAWRRAMGLGGVL
jgi:hypothetical protein